MGRRALYLNFAETDRDPASFWTEQTYHRLRRIKAAVDPTDVIRANHPIPPARGDARLVSRAGAAQLLATNAVA